MSTTTTRIDIDENLKNDVEDAVNIVTQNVIVFTATPGMNIQPEPRTDKIPKNNITSNNQAVTEYSQYVMKPGDSLSYEVMTENVAWKKHINDDIKYYIEKHSSELLPMEKLPPFIYIIVDSELYKIHTKRRPN